MFEETIRQIRRINRFFLGQLLYPLVLSSLLALILYAGRVYFSGSFRIYANLVKNLFLAWLPYLFSIGAAAVHRIYPRQWLLLLPLAGLWLLFFPNAPYIVTDFLHLEERPYIPIWYDILLLATFSWTGIFLAITSLRTMQEITRRHLGTAISWLFATVALALSGLGIYLGRFERWNSWDLLIHPRSVVADVATRLINPTENLRFVGFTALITAFLVVCYLTFISVHKLEETEE